MFSSDVIVLEESGWSSVADVIAGVQAVGSAIHRHTLYEVQTVEMYTPLGMENFLVKWSWLEVVIPAIPGPTGGLALARSIRWNSSH